METQGGHQVNPVQRRLHEHFERRSDCKTNEEFKGEPNIADELEEEECFMRIGLGFIQSPEGDIVTNVPDSDVPDDWNPEVGMCLQTEGSDGDEDEEDGSNGNHFCPM